MSPREHLTYHWVDVECLSLRPSPGSLICVFSYQTVTAAEWHSLRLVRGENLV